MDSHDASPDSIASLIRGIVNDVRTLIREEIALARFEISEQVDRARSAAIGFGIAAAALAFAGTFALIAIALGIAALFGWPTWAGFLVVAAVLGVVGFVSLASARKQLRSMRPVPTETVSTLKENSEWIAKRLSSARR